MGEIQSIERLRDRARKSEQATRQMQEFCMIADSLLARAEQQEAPLSELILKAATLYTQAIQLCPKAASPYMGLARIECLWGSEQRALMLINQVRQMHPRNSDALKMSLLLKKHMEHQAYLEHAHQSADQSQEKTLFQKMKRSLHALKEDIL